MENLGLSASEELVPRFGPVRYEGLTELTLPATTNSPSGSSQTELIFTQFPNDLDLPQVRETGLEISGQDSISMTAKGSSPVASTDPLTGQAVSQAVDQAVQATYQSLTSFTQNDFIEKAALGFGNRLSSQVLANFCQEWEAGNFEGLPTIELRSSEELEGAQGAFSVDTNTIYLSQEYLGQNASNSQAIADILLEEIGHYVDSQVNSSDAAGDEGAIFSALVQGVQLSKSALQRLKEEDDTATIALDGQAIQVEQASGYSIKDTSYSIPSRARFVSPRGSNSNRGTQASPWRTLDKAINSAPDGSTIVLRGGTYRQGGLTIGKELTFQPYPHEKVWIKGSLNVEGWDREGSIWRKDNWRHGFESVTDRRQIDPARPIAAKRDLVFIDGNSLKQVSSKSQVGRGEFYVDYASNKLYIGSNPGGRLVEATAFENGVIFNRPSRNSVVRGLGFAHYAENAITVNTSDVVLDKNTVVWNSLRGAIIYGEDAVIRGNTFSYNGMSGVLLSQSHQSLVEKNTFAYNNIEGFRTAWSGAGVKFARTNSIVLRDNIVAHNYSRGLWGDVFSRNATIVRNIARDNQSSGIAFELSQGAIIASNLSVYNGGSGIFVQESAGAKVWNNTLSNNAVDIIVRDGKRRTPWQVTNNIIKNNILSNVERRRGSEAPGDGTPLLLDVLTFNQPSRNQMVTELDFNAYYRNSPSDPYYVSRMSLPQNGNRAKEFRTVLALRLATRFEDHGLAIGDVAVNPFFVNEGGGNYQLKSGSPAIRRGQPLPRDIARAIGVQAGVRVNLGTLRLPNW